MSNIRPYILSIAGFDPSGGAGILADIKTAESNKVYGLGVVSALTFQNDVDFEKVEWIPIDKIIAQVEVLQKRFKFEYIKIGLIENLEMLLQLVVSLKDQPSTCKIIWDPILKASAGFEFHKEINKELLEKIISAIFMITPNVPEALKLGSNKTAEENAKYLAAFCNVLLKGGHNETKPGYDYLYTKEGKQFSFKPKCELYFGKHGSGCVFSSALTANLARGYKLHPACLRSKEYTAKFLSSNKTNLGYHKL